MDEDLPLPIPEVDPSEVGARARDIVSGAEYRQTESVFERAGRWLENAFENVLGALGEGGASGVVAWLVFLAALAAVGWLVLRMVPLDRLQPPRRPAVVVQTTGPAATSFRTAVAWRSEADRLATERRFDEAVRARYRAVLADLIAAGVLEDVPGRTPGEYRVEFGAAVPGRRRAFDEMTDRFEVIWYGPAHAGRDDLAAFVAAEEAVLAAAPQAVGASA